jgi:hypothetical protein
MLKGLVLAGMLVATWAVLQGIVFQLRAPQKAFASMVAWFAPLVPAYVLLYLLTPADLGVLTECFTRAATPLGLLNGLAVLVLLFLTGVLFYYHADRSITVRLLIELARAPQQRLSLAQLQAVCGVEVLMQDRLDTMTMNGFLVRRDGRYHLAPKGRLGGLGGTLARRVLTMKAL